MRVIDYPKDMKNYIGEEFGVSEWVTVDQPMIDKFADATGDLERKAACRGRRAREAGNARRQDYSAWLSDLVLGAATRGHHLVDQKPQPRR